MSEISAPPFGAPQPPLAPQAGPEDIVVTPDQASTGRRVDDVLTITVAPAA